MKLKNWYYFLAKGPNSLEWVETRKLETSVKEVRKWAKENHVKIDGGIRLSKNQF